MMKAGFTPEKLNEIEALRRQLAPFEQRLQNHPFLCSDSPTAADCATFGQLTKLVSPNMFTGFLKPIFDSAVDLFGPDMPKLAAWYECMVQATKAGNIDFSGTRAESLASGIFEEFDGKPLPPAMKLV